MVKRRITLQFLGNLGLALSAVCLLLGVWLTGQQKALSDRVVRLHVIGSSDSDEDQAAKLLARDSVLDLAGPLLAGVAEQEEAMEVLEAHLEELTRAAAQAAGVPARATLEEEAWFPTKTYPDFALPAGRYPALKITLGEGKGRNWWCVVFPPLCMEAVTEETRQAWNLSPDQIALITGKDRTYQLRFKALELWNTWTRG